MSWDYGIQDDRPLSAESVRLVAIDLDGTLLRSDGSICAPSAEAIAEASERGIKVILASGRAPRKMIAIAEALGLKTPMVAHNGAEIYDPIGRHTVARQTMPAELARQVVQITRETEPDITVGVEIDGKCYTDSAKKRLNQPSLAGAATGPGSARGSAEAATIAGAPQMSDTQANERALDAADLTDPVGSLADVLTQPVTKVMMIGGADVLGGIQMALQAKLAKQVGFAFSDLKLLQVVRAGVDKAVAIKGIAKHYGIQREEVMAIGDAPNDLGMIEWAGLGISPANGWHDVRAAAHFTCPSNDDAGVAAALRKYALL